jgi:hypothetical protein
VTTGKPGSTGDGGTTGPSTEYPSTSGENGELDD